MTMVSHQRRPAPDPHILVGRRRETVVWVDLEVGQDANGLTEFTLNLLHLAELLPEERSGGRLGPTFVPD